MNVKMVEHAEAENAHLTFHTARRNTVDLRYLAIFDNDTIDRNTKKMFEHGSDWNARRNVIIRTQRLAKRKPSDITRPTINTQKDNEHVRNGSD